MVDFRQFWHKKHVSVWILGLTGLALGAGAGLRAFPGPDEASKGRGRRSTPPSAKSLKALYEVEDISAADVARILASIAAIAGVLISGVFFMAGHLRHGDLKRDAALTSVQKTMVMPPLPHLQVHPLGDFGAYWNAQRHLLNNYGWTGSHHAHARIPIARAMALEAGRSLDQAP